MGAIKQVLKVSGTMPHDDTLWHADTFQFFLFKLSHVKIGVIFNLVQCHINQGTGGVLYRFKYLIKRFGCLQFIKDVIGDGLICFVMESKFLQYFGLFQPVLHELGWEFNKFSQNVGTCKIAVGCIGDHAVMSVSHFVEKSSDTIKRDGGRTGALGKVFIVGNDGDSVHGIDAGYQVLGLPMYSLIQAPLDLDLRA